MATTFDTPPIIDGFEVFKPLDATPTVYRIVWRYKAYDGLTPVVVNVETTTTDEMTAGDELQADAETAATAEYLILDYIPGW